MQRPLCNAVVWDDSLSVNPLRKVVLRASRGQVRPSSAKCSTRIVQTRRVPAGFERGSMREFEELARSEEKVDKGKSLFRYGDHYLGTYRMYT